MDYYPYGKVLRSYAGSELDRYGYQASEREKEISDNDYYTLFRGLDAEIARWKQVDPKWNQSESPYASMAENPVSNTDVNGDCSICPNEYKNPDQSLIKKDNTVVYAPKPDVSLAKPANRGVPTASVSEDNSTPAMKTLMTNNAKTLANGGTGANLVEKVAYQAGQALGSIAKLPATVTLPLMAFTPGAGTLLEGPAPTIYRAVSNAEMIDIGQYGMRSLPGAYETGKLFAPTIEEAVQFGMNNFKLDGVANTIMEVKVPNNILQNATWFSADNMNAISIPYNNLGALQSTPLNYSPLIH